MRGLVAVALTASLLAGLPVAAQRTGPPPSLPSGPPPQQITGLPTRTSYVSLGQNANAVLVEPATGSPKSHIAILVTHPERANNLDYFIGRELPKYGYRAMMLNYYGREQSYYEFLKPLAAAIRALRALPGVDTVILAGHSSGGAELSSYQDVAENGAAACQGAERIEKCPADLTKDLPRADGIILLDANTGAPDKTMALNPAVDEAHPRRIDPALDMYSPANGYDPATQSASYAPDFLRRFFAGQGAKADRLIRAAQDRLAAIEAGKGDYSDDEPFVVAGAGVNNAGARIELADLRLMNHTHAAHPLLMPDGTAPVRPIARTIVPEAHPYRASLLQTTQNTTVRHYLSFQALAVTPDYAMTADSLLGVRWRSTANSLQGNLEGVRVPTLIVAATCSSELVLLEISFDHAAAKDKEFVGVEGADHNFQPCAPGDGNTYRRAFDHVDGWLSRPDRFRPTAPPVRSAGAR